jgi:glycerophosphoryl diester phosphodiesterase
MTKSELPILIAHGGGNREFPDNTLEAFYNAYSVSKDVMMETDVSITKDGVVILSHDTTIDRKTNETGAIADWNYSDLIAQRVDFGYTNPTKSGVLNGERVKFTTDDGKNVTPLDVTYPEGVTPRDNEIFYATTLEELIAAFPNNHINVEIKQDGELGIRCLDAIIELLEEYDAFGRVVLASFHDGIYDEFCRRKDEGELPESFMYSPGIMGVVGYYLLTTVGLDIFFGDGIAVLQLPTSEYGIKLATKRIVKSAHAHNIAVHYWTVNDKDEMRELIGIGADGIMTDYPHRLAEVYAEYTE